VAAITCTIAGIVMIVVWKDNINCSIWRLTTNDDDYSNIDSNNLSTNDYWYDYWNGRGYPQGKPDYCQERSWAVVAFVTALLWFATSGCIVYFVKSGRHTKWEEKLQAAADADTDTTAIEMGTVQHQQQEQPSAAIAVATTSATIAATSYVLPDIPDKIDNV